MRRNLIILGSIVVVGTALLAFAHHGPEIITLDAAADKKSGVEFPHWAHQGVVTDCTTCHHTQENLTAENAEGVEVPTCASCHLDPEDEAVPSMREMSLKKNPMHAGCIDCHKTEDAGPTKCNDCHPKE